MLVLLSADLFSAFGPERECPFYYGQSVVQRFYLVLKSVNRRGSSGLTGGIPGAGYSPLILLLRTEQSCLMNEDKGTIDFRFG